MDSKFSENLMRAMLAKDIPFATNVRIYHIYNQIFVYFAVRFYFQTGSWFN